MKKLLTVVLLISCLLLVLVGCSKNKEEESKKAAEANKKVNEAEFFTIEKNFKEFQLDEFLKACGAKDVSIDWAFWGCIVKAEFDAYDMEIQMISDDSGTLNGSTLITLKTKNEIYAFGNDRGKVPEGTGYIQCRVSSFSERERLDIEENVFNGLITLAKSGTLKTNGTECPFKGTNIRHYILSATNQWQEHND